MTLKGDIKRYYNFWFSVDQLYSQWAKTKGITTNEAFVLDVIRDHPGTCTQLLLSQKLQLPKQTVNSILAGMEADGYIIKVPSETDRRNKIIEFTDKGHIYAEEILSEMYRFEEAALYNMSPEQRKGMLDNCEIFLELLKNAFNERKK